MPKQTALKCFDVGRIHADQIDDAARQDVAEEAEAARSTVFGANCQAIAVLGCRIASGVERKQIAEMRLNGGIQRLIHIVRDGIERAAKRATASCGFSGLELYVSRMPKVQVSFGVTFHVSCA